MDIVGERILIFGDSLSHHGVDSAPEIWDVDTGSNRVSSAPGDLLASHLLEQGAEAVRVDANVSRSAPNFWRGGARYQFHNAAELIADDRAWQPTKVIVMLGTNDAHAGAFDPAAMTKIRDAYKAMGAEVWAIGPPTFTSSALNAKADQIYTMMRGVFGGRLIDARPLTPQEERANDGIHFRPMSASILAMQLLNALLITRAPKRPWVGIALGVGVFGLLGLWIYRRRRSTPINGLNAVDERLIQRVAQLLAYNVPKQEIRDRIIAEGYTDEDAFLAYKAAKMYLKQQDEPLPHELEGNRLKGSNTLGEPVELIGPRGENLGLIIEVETPGPTVGITTEDGRKFLYDKMVSEHRGYPVYREWRDKPVLNGSSMLKTIAAESRSPEEFARRAEAWASSEANPPSITKMTTYYRRTSPGKLSALIREARKKRESASRQRHEGFISQPDEDEDLDGI